MPRQSNVHCPICDRLWDATHPSRKTNQPGGGYVQPPVMGKLGGQPMKRLYTRSGNSHTPVGHICEAGHVILDSPPEEPHHVLTPTLPRSVICWATGEKLAIPGYGPQVDGPDGVDLD